jgi:glycine/D-amino acid oxidase-like deaminating enzyme
MNANPRGWAETRAADVIVVGGGVIGTSVAYHLVRRKASVILVETDDLAAGSSGACDGLVFLQSKKPGIHLKLALESRDRFAELSEDLPFPIEYRRCGGLVIIEDEAQYRLMTTYARDQRDIGLDVTLLDAAAARKLEPALSPSIAGAAYSAMDGQVNPIALTQALGQGARRLGARIMTRTTVTGICRRENRVVGIETNHGRLNADTVVNAAGAWGARIGAMAGVAVPIRPRRGQILVTRAVAPLISHCMISASYITAKYDPQQARTAGEGISIEQSESGNLLLGATREFVGYDRRTTIEGIRRIARKTSALLPQLARLYVIRSFAGLRPYTPDGLPILGPVQGLSGFFMAAGHEGDGIALAPVTGHLVAQSILDGRSDIPLDDFRLERFGPDDFKEDKHAGPSR